MLVDACQLQISDVADLITVALRAFLQFCYSIEIEFISPCFGVADNSGRITILHFFGLKWFPQRNYFAS